MQITKITRVTALNADNGLWQYPGRKGMGLVQWSSEISGRCVQLKHGGGACVLFCHPQAACVIGQQAGYKKAAVLLLLRVICLKSQNNQYETKTVTGYQRWKVIKVALSVKYLSVPTVITVTVSQVSNQYISSLSSCSFSAIAAGCIQSGHRTP